jgi:hypothetical protein
MDSIAIRNTKPGEYIKRKPDAAAVYKRGHYVPGLKAFSCIDCEDINREIFIKANRAVYVGFTYYRGKNEA